AAGIREVGPLADVYGLGAILYTLLVGHPPFQAAHAVDVFLAVLQRDPMPPRQLNAGVSRDLETICLKCLEKLPHRRYASGQHLVADLHRFLEGEPILARRAGRPEIAWRWIRRHPAQAGLRVASVIALMALATLGVGLEQQRLLRANNRQLESLNAALETANT